MSILRPRRKEEKVLTARGCWSRHRAIPVWEAMVGGGQPRFKLQASDGNSLTENHGFEPPSQTVVGVCMTTKTWCTTGGNQLAAEVREFSTIGADK